RSSWRLAREGETAHSGKALINAVTRSSAPAQAPTRDETCRDGCGSGPRWVNGGSFLGQSLGVQQQLTILRWHRHIVGRLGATPTGPSSTDRRRARRRRGADGAGEPALGVHAVPGE